MRRRTPLPTVDGCPPRRSGKGFTLVEILVSLVVLSLIVVMVANLAGSANFAWLQGERNVEVYQNGRAVLEMMSRELSQAAMSNRLQFVQSPGQLNIPPDPEPQQVAASPLFWQAPLANTPKGNLCEIGYYLVRREPKPGVKGAYQLKRFFVRPDNTHYGIGSNYWVTDFSPGVNAANWIAGTSPGGNPPQGLPVSAFSSTAPAGDPDASVVTTLSEGVLGLWVRCLDENGDPIPWMNLAGGRSNGPAGGIKFNSAGCFQPAVAGQKGADGTGSFTWTNAGNSPYTPPATAQACRLPCSVEITIAQVDQRTAANVSNLPTMPQSSGPADIPANIAKMQQAFDAQHIVGGHIFATRVILPKQ